MMKNGLEHVVGKLLAPLRSPLREYGSAQLTPPFTTGYQRISVLNQWRSPNFVVFFIFGLPALIGGCSTHTESYWVGNKQAETNHQPVDRIALDILKKTAVSSGLDLYSSTSLQPKGPSHYFHLPNQLVYQEMATTWKFIQLEMCVYQ